MNHGSIVLDAQACTACDICVRECPTWCIAISSHKETVQVEGTRPRTMNLLDRFEINWALCMYCGICIEECPFDALSWSEQAICPATSPEGLVRVL